jgi:hypothetical protein
MDVDPETKAGRCHGCYGRLRIDQSDAFDAGTAPPVVVCTIWGHVVGSGTRH